MKIIIAVPVTFLALIAGMTILMSETSGNEFCDNCHVMQPFIKTYARSSHSGINPDSVSVKCTDCHLPQDNILSHVTVKGWKGTREVFVNTVYDTIVFNSRREDFTYDSGCISCHDLTEVDTKNQYAKTEHDFMRSEDISCVTCHKHVGHIGTNPLDLLVMEGGE